MKFEKRRQRDDESIDMFLDDLDLLRRRVNLDERISERNLAIASKFMDGVKSYELKTTLNCTALNCVMAKRANERDSARKISDILLNRFGSGVQGHQAMVKFEKRRQRDDESIGKFLDELELLRRRSNPDERISERNLAIASKFMDGVKSDELKTMLATHFTLSLDQVPTPDDLRMKSREYLLLKRGRKTVTAIMATTAEQTLARTPVGTDLVTTWIRGGHAQFLARWTTMFPPVLLINRT